MPLVATICADSQEAWEYGAKENMREGLSWSLSDSVNLADAPTQKGRDADEGPGHGG